MIGRRKIVLALLACLVAGCTGKHWNVALTKVDVQSGYRFLPPVGPKNSESLFVILTLSGGGTRAAALSYGAMEKLRDTNVVVHGEKRRLLDEVDVISSVSGGSFPAAYYGLYGDRLFEDFKTRFLDRKVQTALVLAFLSPWNWPRLWTPDFDRIDLAAEYYGKHLFDDQTFATMEQRNRTPLIVLNATDIARNNRFEFTQDEFDLLCADLSKFPIARAVAASSAFPFAFTPLTIKAYPRQCGYREPQWLANAREERPDGSRRFYNAQLTDAYLDPRTHYVHLLDGGLADNIGLRGPLQALASTDNPRSAPEDIGDRSILQKINLEKIDTILVIAVNARTTSRDAIGQDRNAPGLVGMIGPVGNGPMGNYSYETIALLKESTDEANRDFELTTQCRELFEEHCRKGRFPEDPLHELTSYSVELTFDSIECATEREKFQSMPTTLQLEPRQVEALVKVGGELLDQNPRFREFLAAFGSP